MAHDKEQTREPKTDDEKKPPAAGPHAKPELTDHEKTPGAGTLPDGDGQEADPGAG